MGAGPARRGPPGSPRLEPLGVAGGPARAALTAGLVLVALALLKPWTMLSPPPETSGTVPLTMLGTTGSSRPLPGGSTTQAGGAEPDAGSAGTTAVAPPPAPANSRSAITCFAADGWRLVVLQRAPAGGTYRSWIVATPTAGGSPPTAAADVIRVGASVLGLGACAPDEAGAGIDMVVAMGTSPASRSGGSSSRPGSPPPAADARSQGPPAPLGPAPTGTAELYGPPASAGVRSAGSWPPGRYGLEVRLAPAQLAWLVVEIAPAGP